MPAEDDRPGSPPRDPSDHLVTTHHEIGTGEDRLRYSVTTGRVVLREEVITDGTFEGNQPRAEIFSTSYLLDAEPDPTRPVTFAFNGGPGSSSVWLHLGLFGPRRVAMGDAGALLPPPYGLTDNLQTLLRVSDLVFLDPVTTGFSRAVSGFTPGDFHGFTRDLESVAEFIRLWTSRYGRWLSPKYLAGESYGTLRAAGLAEMLGRDAALYLNGLILVSSVLDIGTVDFTEGNDLPFSLYLPTYAAAAHYHGKVAGELADVITAAEEFAAGDLPWALARGSRLSEDDRVRIVRRYAELTGLSEDFVDRANLRVTLEAFTAELLRGEGKVLGRLDLRFTGWPERGNADEADYDPSHAAITGPYGAALNHYVRHDLGFSTDLIYNILTPKVNPWSFSEFEGSSVEVTAALGRAMRANPALRVHVSCGYYDGATPHFAAEHVFAHLRLPADQRDRITWAYYGAGHMMYVHEPSRLRQSEDLAAFVRGP